MTAGAVAAPRIIPIMHLDRLRAKNHIDTSTHVCIQSDTRDTQVFFTLDGSKPLRDHGGSGRVSGRYCEPFLLPAGRICIRAMAATSDGRESATVTKVFLVQQDEKAEPSRLSSYMQEAWHQQHSAGDKDSPVSTRSVEDPLSSLGSKMAASAPRFLRSRQAVPAATPSASPNPQSERAGLLQQTRRTQRQADFLRCARCVTFPPSHPLATFCTRCGVTLPPAGGGQLVCCVSCNTQVPVNTPFCLICHASIKQQLLHQSSLQDHVVCSCCGQRNPADMSKCLTCETELHTTALETNGAPPVPSTHNRKLTCSKCKRLNNNDARYCDWCGCKVQCVSSVLCGGCGTDGGTHHTCAAPLTSCDDLIQPSAHQTAQTTPSSLKLGPPTRAQHTQTIGLHYPSATALGKKQQTVSKQTLTAISPGRGYWRRQLDHVCAHLRSFAQNNAPFRTLMGEPRLGRMVSAVLEEDAHEVSVTISFMAASQEVRQEVRRVSSNTLSSVTERSGSGKKTSVTVRDSLPQEVGPARGHQLLDQGADPHCCGSVLATAHHQALPVLADQPSGAVKTTAPHQAAMLASAQL
ncbi:double zinc ribbon and ankyrin repeat-containing protein 1-like isoform X1 [Entelurus aequoreus]|uniref:double zinc ribbon and ankyrin repeat-containing protein 1-like isoform X1 n=2 Tax=Entelurus aequoreus TaxID=161455 RepID=UPI002B1D50D9|nr:double zinc ribbon and ankyrin repeat-containing protein 1-like isoform X1 [Entelurus aequoreus]